MSKSLTKRIQEFFTLNRSFKLSLILLGILSIIFFDLSIAIGGDDAEYILSAKNFANGSVFPGWHGALYPIFLSIPFSLFGFSISLFKFLSLILILVSFVLFYYTFRNRVGTAVLVPSLLLVSVNYFILFFASQTSSEALYLPLQALVLFYLFKLYDGAESDIRSSWIDWLVLGLSAFLLTQTRNVGYSIVVVAPLFFLLNKRYKSILYFLVSFLIFFLLFNIYKQIVWERGSIGLESQFAAMFYKDPYNHLFGYESFGGFIDRFVYNTNFYLSNAVIKMFGFRSMVDMSTNWLITLALLVVFFIVLRKSYQSNKYIFFVCLLSVTTLGVTFITQQIRWSQARLVLIILPFIYLMLFYFLESLQTMKFKYSKNILGILALVIFISSLSMTLKENEKKSIFKALSTRDKLKSYTPDYKHYLEVAQWTGKNIDKNKRIGCRKPDIATIYSGGNSFVGIYNLTMNSIQEVKVESKYHYLVDIDGFLKYSSYEMPFEINRFIHCYLVGSDKVYIICAVPDTIGSNLGKLFNDLQIPFSTNYEKIRSGLLSIDKNSYAVYPDTLLSKLKQNEVEYLLYANLRLNKEKKDGQLQNSVEKTMDYIYLKYPGFIKRLVKFGEDNDEPASLMELNYGVETF